MWNYIRNILIGLDQWVTTWVGGHPDETLSSYAYRLKVQGKPFGFMCDAINAIFWWQSNHCRGAYRDERERRQMPPELRGSPIEDPTQLT
jgi:hypothetical protein